MGLPQWLKTDLIDLAIGLLDDQRVQVWVDKRITNALDTQRDEIFGKIELSGAGVVNETKSAINATQSILQGNINGIGQALTLASNSITAQIVSQIKNIIPFHLLKKPCPKCGYREDES